MLRNNENKCQINNEIDEKIINWIVKIAKINVINEKNGKILW